LGAQLIIVGRDTDKGIQAERDIRASTHNPGVEFVQADLSLIREARRLGDEVADRFSELHYLVHSAGVVRGRHVVTGEGFESNFATNYLSRFTLTVRLLPVIQAAGRSGKSARILLIAHPGFDGTIHYEDVNLTTNFSMIRAFKQFHYANDVFAAQLTRRLKMAGEQPSVTISCLHPGPTKTNIDKEMPLWMKLLVQFVVHPLFSHAPDVPAAMAVKLLLADEFEGKSGGLFSMVGKFKPIPAPRNVQDPEQGERLWAVSEALVQSVMAQTTPMLPTESSGEPIGNLLHAR
jgi:NAD(P)-dependent dehydrogenase (short-subunit alcohol dehydrogenase family)